MSTKDYLISEKEKSRFAEEGYLYIDSPLFDTHDYLNLKAYLYKFILELDPKLRGAYFTSDPSKKPSINNWVASPPILNIVKQFLGENIIFFNIACCYKAPHSKTKVSVHTDSHYWRLEKLLDPVNVLILFIPFSDMSVESGCLQVIPKQLDSKLYHYKTVDPALNYFGYEIEDSAVDHSKLVPFPMKENTLFLLKEDLIHASGPNTTSDHRLGITLRFISADANYLPSEFDKHRKMYLLNGKNINNIPCAPISEMPLVTGFSWSRSN